MEQSQSYKLDNNFSNSRKLRILLDARKITGGGIGVYTQNLISGLVQEADIDLTLILNSKDIEIYKNEDWFNLVNIIEDNAKNYSFDEFVNLSTRINSKNYDLYHNPHYILPFRLKIPSVITLHDIIQVTHPEKFYYPFVAKRLISSALSRANRVLTISSFSSNEIKRVFPDDKISKKINIIPNSLSSDFLTQKVNSSKFTKTNYLMSVFSNNKPHKGLLDLVNSFKKIKLSKEIKNTSNLKLFLVGNGIEDVVEDEKLLSLISEIDDIHLIGKVSKSDLIALYDNAQALVVSSLNEGFCLPVIEAHSRGIPVISRPVPAVKELLTKQDFLCDDFSDKSLIDGMLRFLKDSELNKNPNYLKESVDKFKQEEVTKTIINVYRDLINLEK